MNEHIPNIENKERPFGFDVVIRSHFQRHAPEDKQKKEITPEGVQLSKKYAQTLRLSNQEKPYLFKAYSSDIDRAKKTTNMIVDAVNTEKKGHTRVNLELGKKTEDFRISIDALMRPYDEYMVLSKKKEGVPGEEISLHDLARRVALHIKHFIDMSVRLKSHSRVDLMNITHLPWISAFLKEAIGKQIEGTEDEEAILKPKFLEGFEFIITRNGDTVSLILKINDKEFPLEEKALNQIIGEYNG